MAEQLDFEWHAPKTFLPGVDGPVIQPTQLAALPTPRRLLRDAVEQYFRDRKIPYVNVDEAKKSLFASAKLGSFHFVAYSKNGPNWLVWAAQMRAKAREDMAEWEKIFGGEFVAVVASEKSTGELAFRTLHGEAVEMA